MHPARSLGRAPVSGDVGDLCIYLVAQPIGSVVAGLTATLGNDPRESMNPKFEDLVPDLFRASHLSP